MKTEENMHRVWVWEYNINMPNNVETQLHAQMQKHTQHNTHCRTRQQSFSYARS